MSKIKNAAYWIFTLWTALGMLSTGIVQLMHRKEEKEMFFHLGYPQYLLTMLGVAKLAGIIVLLVPGLGRMKVWVYIGYVYMMAGAVLSHLAMQDEFKDIFPSLLLLALTILSWSLLPQNRKIYIVR
jgi:mannose/fructose/N-acetylgalactosamine-specific phosphotransferase system component IID